MKDELVSFETAKLAKEKGFDEECIYCYSTKKDFTGEIADIESAIDYTGNLFFDSEDMVSAKDNGYDTYLAPTQSLLQRWLREKYNLHIYINCIGLNIWSNMIEKFDIDGTGPRAGDLGKKNYKTCEQALEAGLQEALKLIDNE